LGVPGRSPGQPNQRAEIRGIIERDVEVLSRRTDTLERALMKGADTLIQRAARTTEAALEAVERSIRIVAAKEE
jgi:hypothetical protein